MASTPRDLLKVAWERLDEEQRAEVEEMALDLWRESLNASKTKQEKGRFICRHCQTENLVVLEVELPDLVTRAKAFEILANQAYGKPEEQRTVKVDVGVQTLEALERLSTLELARLAGGYLEAEFEELEPAPELPPAA